MNHDELKMMVKTADWRENNVITNNILRCDDDCALQCMTQSCSVSCTTYNCDLGCSSQCQMDCVGGCSYASCLNGCAAGCHTYMSM